MNIEEYNTKLKEIQAEYENKKRDLIIFCCKINNPHNIGDVITDHIGSIKIEKIGFSAGFYGALPCCSYTGLVLKKDGLPTKKGEKRTVHQSNIINN